MNRVDVAVLPVEALTIDADCYVVVDALRATTTMAVAFERGLASLVVTGDIAEARKLGAGSGAVLLGEERGVAPEGFDFGNSPLELEKAQLKGKKGVMVTTNGTRALCGLAGKGAVAAGALVNAGAVVEWLRGHDRAVVVCAGNGAGARFGLEDFMVAGTIVRMAMEATTGIAIGDAARAAMSLAGHWGAAGLRGSEHARYLVELG
ncbi:MAG: 2-phosphosulfolactate phosphatase, partial [Dehalococcoidia bacterium]